MPASSAARFVEGAKDSKPPPRMPGTQQTMIQAQRCVVRRTPKPTIRVAAIEMRPEGVFRRAAIGGAKPKFWMSVAE